MSVPHRRPSAVPSRLALGGCLLLLAAALRGQGTPVGIEEDFALSTDRRAVIERMLPGTEEASYFRCLLLQHEGRLDEVQPVLDAWKARHGHTERVREIEHRQRLLTFERDPKATYAYIVQALSLRFDHARDVPGEAPDVPTRLDPSLVSRATFTKDALALGGTPLGGVRGEGLRALAGTPLTDEQLRALLGRLAVPDVPDLAQLVVRELRSRNAGSFGSLKIHENLLLAQLEECSRLMPALLDNDRFLTAMLKRLQPNDDVDWQADADVRQAYLERLEAFVARLSAAHDMLRVHVRYHRLDHDRRLGVYDKERFLAYLRLPRPQPYVSPRLLELSKASSSARRSFDTGLPPVHDDWALVQDYLMHFFRLEESFESFAEFVKDDVLRRTFAETMILYGLGDADRWYAMLEDPAAYRELEQRVELKFPLTLPENFAVDDPVVLEIDCKNVPTLLVKVFEIDTFNVYAEGGGPVYASIALDGLVAHEETLHTYDDSPFLRVRRTFTFPSLDERGVYVVEFIGNGVSSRAVIRKGALRHTERSSAAGLAITVRDESGRRLDGARAWLDGKEHVPGANGEILLPFSTSDASRRLILQYGDFSSLARVELPRESYSLRAHAFVERETLLAGRTAHIVVRPELLLESEPVSLTLLEDAELSLTAVGTDGVRSQLSVRDPEPNAAGDIVHEIAVSEALARVEVRFTGRVRQLADGQHVAVQSDVEVFEVNGIDATARTASMLLTRTPAGWAIDALGKNGEPKADQVAMVNLTHREFVEPARVQLKTDAAGRIHLGALPDITSVTAYAHDEQHTWHLDTDRVVLPDALHGMAGRTLRVPLPLRDGVPPSLDRQRVSLIELRGDAPYSDRFAHLAVDDGFLELRELPPGTYVLVLHDVSRGISVRITAGELHDGWFMGRKHMLEAGDPSLGITALEADDAALTVRLGHATEDTLVLVTSTRWLPAFDAYARLALDARHVLRRATSPREEAEYESGRVLGDEYRYILERRFARIFPGTMLRRPSLLLNPWALDEAEVHSFAGKSGARAATGKAWDSQSTNDSLGSGGGRSGHVHKSGSPNAFANLDFLAAPAAVLVELRPDAQGVVRVPRASLGAGHMVTVVAWDATHTATASLVLPEQALARRDRRLLPGLDASRAVSEQRRMTVLDAGAAVTVEDASTADLALHDSLASVFGLLRAVAPDLGLAEFAFLLQWPDLSRERKLELYGRYACHELHLFLHEKDRPFFDEVVRPYLAQKLHRTFLDHWLLDEDLSRFTELAEYARLNVVERALLARRLPDQADGIERGLREQFDLVPTDLVRQRLLFDIALRGAGLDATSALGAEMAKLDDEVAQKLRELGYVGDSFEEADEGMSLQLPPAPSATVPGAPAMFSGRGVRKLAADADRRSEVQARFRDVEPTRSWAEHEYYHRRRHEQHGALIPLHAFWVDFAAARGQRPFVSPHVLLATSSLNEALLALAVLDLPFRAEPPVIEREGSRLSVSSAGPALLVLEEIAPAAPAEDAPPVLVSQDIFRSDDRYVFEGNRRLDRFVRDEFLVDVVYGCQIVLTNPTSAPRDLELLVQVPRGAIGVSGTEATRSLDVSLPPFGTHTLESAFYFPAPGEFSMYPAHVSQGGRTLAAAEARTLRVVRTPTVIDTASWIHVSQQGTRDDVMAFLGSANLARLPLHLIAWRMRDASFHRDVLALLRARHTFHAVLWSYGLLHGDAESTRELLRWRSDFLAACGPVLDSPLLTIDPVDSGWYEHIEFDPLVNARAHRLGGTRTILVPEFAQQYGAFLHMAAHRPALRDSDWLQATYYFLLQDRIEEAMAAFARVAPGALPTRIQYDYVRAYLAFLGDTPQSARAVAEGYRDHPVPRWRDRFRDVLAQLDEAAGGPVAPGTEGDRTAGQTALAAGEPSLELETAPAGLLLRHANLPEVEVRYYAMDVELLFSTNPFVQQDASAFSSIRPNRVDVLELPDDAGTLPVPLPPEFASRNVLVEVRGGGLVRRQPSFANALAVRMIESYGQLQVTSAADGAPLPRVYVKVYGRLADGRVRFHKDGYTDLRGRFDYVSLSAPDGEAERYGVLVLSDEHGAVVREAAPPPR